jgi:hypothetical protein
MEHIVSVHDLFRALVSTSGNATAVTLGLPVSFAVRLCEFFTVTTLFRVWFSGPGPST